jgi:hypothetical protein
VDGVGNLTDWSLTFDAAKALERGRDDTDSEMGFTTLPRARMSGMARAFVLNRKEFRGECRFELRPQSVRDRS